MDQQIPKQRLIVIHSHKTWLQLTETWLYTQLRYLPKTVESHIVCESTVNLDQFHLPNIHCCPRPRWQVFPNYFLRKLRCRGMPDSLLRIAKREKAVILHSHYGFTGWKNMRVAELAGLKHIVTFYGLDVSRFPQTYPLWRKRYFNMFSEIDCVLCEGTHMAKSVIALGCPEEKIRIHHLGVQVDKIRFQPRKWDKKGPLRVLIAASFREKKGIPFALEALGQVASEVSLDITLIGDAGPDEMSQLEKQKIKATIAKSGLAGKVRLLGYQPHTIMFEEAYKHHIFLSPSVTACDGDAEGGVPVGIIEVASSGMPVLSTRHCDIQEVLQHRVSGLLAEERDVEGLAEHLRWLIGNPGRWGPMVQAARKHIETQYNAQKQGEKLAAIYKEISEL